MNDKDNSCLKYSIIEDNSPFSIDSSTGNVYPLSYCNKDDEYTITVQAHDDIDIKDAKIISKQGKLGISVGFSYFKMYISRRRNCERGATMHLSFQFGDFNLLKYF